jgi:hypothetical protein
MKKLLILVMFLIGWPYVTAEAQPLLKKGDINFGKLLAVESYDGKGLYGYIDGGAELYREYGFRRLEVYTIADMKDTIKVEVYRMTGALAAFGIFSVNRIRCTGTDNLFQFSCADQHQLQAIQGDYYFRIVNERGSPRAAQFIHKTALLLKQKLGGSRDALTPLLTTKEFRDHLDGLKYCTGPLGIQNGAPDISEFVEGIDRFSMYYLPFEVDSVNFLLVDVDFINQIDPVKFMARLGFKGSASFQETHAARNHRFLWIKDPTHVIYMNATKAEKSIAPFLNAVEQYRVQ